ncbi:MAG: hypothetical protein IJQ62_14960 [Clostridia bacterium]|nr:hypothetical protein [Clostridia bacterium]
MIRPQHLNIATVWKFNRPLFHGRRADHIRPYNQQGKLGWKIKQGNSLAE